VTGATRYGAWPSPITSALIVQAAASLGEVQRDGDEVWWSELRPSEGGRVQIVRRGSDGVLADMLPEHCSARTRVHEYGGGAWWVHRGVLFFGNWEDQRLYRVDPGGSPTPITPEPAIPHGDRYADGIVTGDGRWIVCVREHHDDGGEARNEIVALPADGSGDVTVLVTGPDFVSNPRLAPDGGTLCWLQWDHPNMPWDETELWVGRFDLDGAAPAVGGAQRLAGGHRESLFQPEWRDDGALHVVSDRTGWWNLYRVDGATLVGVAPVAGEVGVPQWVFRQSRYAFLDDGSTICAVAANGFDRLCVLRPGAGTLDDLAVPYTAISSVTSLGDRVALVGATPVEEPAVVTVDAGSTLEVIRPPRDLGLDRALLSTPRPVDFPSAGGRTSHALFYAPKNPDAEAPEDEKPPLLVVIHGGPTSAARPMLSLSVQYWTSRGFAVVDVNYGGSTGYGREYRDLLQGSWGVVDVEDCVHVARGLADQGEVDGDRLAIRGGSAGGYTTLAALAFHDTFAAGASHYGVADLEALATDTHKFESRYLDGMIGPYPQARDVYVARSPIHHTDGFSRPLIVFQGLEDAVVPPNQAEMIVDALRRKGVPVAYVPFVGEQHGFRRAENIRRALDGELYFYGRVFGFTPADDLEPVEIDNL
jgi:dipeptidyl aminopeptidase/acylaminoacyl peptidase